MTDQEEARPLVWQRPEQLLQLEVLGHVLSAFHDCWPGLFLGPNDRSSGLETGRIHAIQVQRESLKGGVSGAHLERLRVEVVLEEMARERRERLSLIFKRMRPHESWLMRSSGDMRCREVQLWRHGLLADMPRVLCVPVLAAAYDEETGEGALLLADLSRWLGTLEDCLAPVPAGQVRQYLDHLARLHAHYWQDERLNDTRFALASVGQALLLLAPTAIQAAIASGDPHPYLPISQAGWEAFFTYGPIDAVEKLQHAFAKPDALLAAAANVPATLVHGDAWPANMGLLPGRRGAWSRSRTILIDWALCTAGPATFDPFWLLFAWRMVDMRMGLLFYRERLALHLARRGILLSVAHWRLLVDLAVVRTVMTCGETMGQDVLFARNGAQRARALARLSWWVRWAARVIERRGWDR